MAEKENFEYQINNTNPDERKRFIRKMFDSIVPTYDLLNRLLSFGIDTRWRKSVVRLTGRVQGRPVLDVCCGTGDLSTVFIKAGANLVSLDFSLNMLEKGKQKGRLGKKVVAADASKLPFRCNSFEFISIAFGIRNIPDIDRFVQESFRVLTENGALIILELTRPENRFVSFLYRFYLEKLLPVVGGIVSGKKIAYDYLAKTIATFIEPRELIALLNKNGYSDVRIFRKTFGVATIYYCQKKIGVTTHDDSPPVS